MSDSVRPHRWQPTRLPCSWDSLGKNTGVGCHFLLQCMTVKSKNEVAQSCPTLSNPMDCSLPGSSAHGIFQARVLEYGVALRSLLCIYYIYNYYIYIYIIQVINVGASQVAPVVKNPPANPGDIREVGLIPGLERSPGGGHRNPLQDSRLENSMDRRAWWATQFIALHRAQSWTLLK